MRFKIRSTIIFLSLFLITCGGGGGGSPTESTSSGSISSQTHTLEAYGLKSFELIAISSGNTITFSVASQPSHGQASVSGNIATYTSNENYVGLDSFQVLAQSNEESQLITISIDVFYNPYRDYKITNVQQKSITYTPDSINGGYTIYTCQYNGIEREFLVYLPNGINPYHKNKLPLLMAFHGHGEDVNPYDLIDVLERIKKYNLIYVGPGGLEGTDEEAEAHPPAGTTGWNYFYPGIRNGNDDVGFVNALINYIHDNYSISHKKIFISGFSSGGTFVPVMGSENELIDGVQSGGSVMHTYYTYQYEQPIKFQVYKGTADEWHPYEYTEEQPTLLGVEEGMIMLKNQKTCSDTTRVTLPDLNGDGNLTERLYTDDCTDGSIFEAFKLINWTHIEPWGLDYSLEAQAADINIFDLFGQMIN